VLQHLAGKDCGPETVKARDTDRFQTDSHSPAAILAVSVEPSLEFEKIVIDLSDRGTALIIEHEMTFNITEPSRPDFRVGYQSAFPARDAARENQAQGGQRTHRLTHSRGDLLKIIYGRFLKRSIAT
jgi:hypothetical protein